MNDATQARVGLILGLLKILLAVAGAIVAGVGFFSGGWPVILAGVAMMALAQVVHVIDQRVMDVQLKQWAAEAVAGIGPVPKRQVRFELLTLARQVEGMRGDVRLGFMQACRDWATEQKKRR